MQKCGFRQRVEQGIGGFAVRHLSADQHKRDGAAKGIGQRVDFRRSTTPRATNRLRPFPLFPPAAQRGAFTAGLSINVSAGGPPVEASALKIPYQMPLSPQQTKRL
jgi:hypothetical protein